MTSDNTLQYTPGKHIYKNKHFSPDYLKDNPLMMEIKSLDGNFETLTNKNLLRGSVKLKQSLCNESYFIWGGFNASQLDFKCYTAGMVQDPNGVSYEALQGKIQFSITPTVYENGLLSKILTDETTILFTGYIENVTPPVSISDGWSVTAYDYLYRLRNLNVAKILDEYLEYFREQEALIVTNKTIRDMVENAFDLVNSETLPLIDSEYFPYNRDISTENGIDLLKEFALLGKKFGVINSTGTLTYVEIKDRITAFNDGDYYCINTFDPKKLKYSAGNVWTPHLFTSDPLTNVYYTIDMSSEEQYYKNVYTVKNSKVLGDKEWIEKLWECDEYGTPSSKYSLTNPPSGLFDVTKMNLRDDEIYYQQEYSIEAYMDPTIPMGSVLLIYKVNLALDASASDIYTMVVESYIMNRTITFESDKAVMCKCSANNGPYNSEAGEMNAWVLQAHSEANRANANIPTISNGTKITKMKTSKVISKTDYEALEEKRDDTLYYVYDDSSS